MENKNEVQEITVEREKIKQVLAKGKDYLFGTVSDFCDDVATISDSVKNLYEEKQIELGLLGVSFHIEVKSSRLGQTLLNCDFGCEHSGAKE